MAGIFGASGFWSCGFDMSPTGSLIFTQTNNGSANSAHTPFSFGYSWALNNQPAAILLNTNEVTVIVGAYVNLSALPASSNYVFYWYDATAGAFQVSLRITSTGALQFYLGNGTSTPIGPASSAGLITAGGWNYIEGLVTISATVGQVIAYVNGTLAITTTATQNTKSTANTYTNAIGFNSAVAGLAYFDDVVMMDTTGTSPLNTFLGPVQCRGDAPNANSAVGGRNAFTPTNPTNVNFSNVANIPANAAEYNFDSNPGDYDMFRYPNLPGTTLSVLAVNEWALLELDSAGARTVSLDCYSNGTDNAGTAFTPASGTPTLYNLVQPVDPHTSAAWTIANAEAAEFGLTVVT